jgi:hypothetical protein
MKSHQARHWTAMFLLALTPACGSDTLPSYTVLQGLRVVGLVLDLPELNFDPNTLSFNPSDTVNVTPVISDPYGNGRNLTYNLYHCLDPGVGLGAVPTCAGNPTRTTVSTGVTFDPNPGVGSFKLPEATGALPPVPISFNIAPLPTLYSATFSSLPAPRKFNGVSILIFFELYPSGEESKKVTVFKRLVLSTPGKTRNLNPTSPEFRIDGAAITGLPAAENRIDAFVPAADQESYQEMNTDGTLSTRTETIDTLWFLTGPQDVECSNKDTCTTDGLFERIRTIPGELNLFKPPRVPVPSSRGRVLIGISKDNRGGAAFTRICDNAGGGAGLCQ